VYLAGTVLSEVCIRILEKQSGSRHENAFMRVCSKNLQKAKSFIYTPPAGVSKTLVKCFTPMAVKLSFSKMCCHHISPEQAVSLQHHLCAGTYCHFNVLAQTFLQPISGKMEKISGERGTPG